MADSKRKELLDAVKGYIRTHGYGPSVRELGELVGLNSTATVHYHLRELEKRGLIVMEKGKNRSISLPKGEEQANPAEAPVRAEPREPLQGGGARIPLVGTVAAGQPILAVEQVEGWLPWEGGEGWFALRVKGESMKNAGILPGDKVIVRPQPTAENGEIVVALLGDEATVKRFFRREGHVWLLPENEAFSPIEGDEAIILGLVRGVVREYD